MRDSQIWKMVEIRPVQQFSRSGQVRTQTEQRQSLNEARHREGQTKDMDRQREEQIRGCRERWSFSPPETWTTNIVSGRQQTEGQRQGTAHSRAKADVMYHNNNFRLRCL